MLVIFFLFLNKKGGKAPGFLNDDVLLMLKTDCLF